MGWVQVVNFVRVSISEFLNWEMVLNTVVLK